MTSPEAARHDLYNGLIEVLGPERGDLDGGTTPLRHLSS
jgi:hypothetical protein